MAYGYGGYMGTAPGYYQQPGTPGYYQQPGTAMTGQYAQPIGTQQVAQPAQQQPQQSGGINWVQGEAGAKSWGVSPGCTVMLMDSEAQTFYLKSTDASGMPLPLRIFDYAERPQAAQGAVIPAQQAVQQVQPAPVDYVPRAEFDALVARVEALTAPKRTRKTQTEEATQDAE